MGNAKRGQQPRRGEKLPTVPTQGKPEAMDGFARRKEQSKEDIRKAALELFSQFGVDKVSMADIARKAGVAQATIYNNFGNKETLAREFATAAVDELVHRVQVILAPKKLYRDKMAAFIQFLSEVLTHDRPLPADNALFTSSVDLQNDPEIRKIRDAAHGKMTKLLLGLVKEGKQQGQVAPDISEAALGIHFGMFMDVFTNPGLQHQFHHDPALVRDLGRLMINGLGGQNS